jgi:hypothetical protein
MTEVDAKRKRKQTAKQTSSGKKQKTLQAFFPVKEEPVSEPESCSVEKLKKYNTGSLDAYFGLKSSVVAVNRPRKRGGPNIVLSDSEKDASDVTESNGVNKRVSYKSRALGNASTNGLNIKENSNSNKKVLQQKETDLNTLTDKNDSVVPGSKAQKPKLKASGTLNRFFGIPDSRTMSPIESELTDQGLIESSPIESIRNDDEPDIITVETTRMAPKAPLPLHPFFMKRTCELIIQSNFEILFSAR